MKCRFCGKRIKKDSNVCSKCGKEVTEGLGTDELIDAMPELHDEFDNISKMQAKDKKKKEKQKLRAQHKVRRIVVAVILVVAILSGAAAGIIYFNNQKKKAAEPEKVVVATSAIDSAVVKSILPSGFSEIDIVDAASAKEALKSTKDMFSFEDGDKEFELDKEIKVGRSTFYRFNQMYNGIPVYGGTMVIMADDTGYPVSLNGIYIPTKGLTTEYLVDEGNASTSITEYVNHLGSYSVVQGISITDIEKVVCSTDNKAYLAYKANVSGYNTSGKYVAYDVFIDGLNGSGICALPTSSFENSSTINEQDAENAYIYEMATVNDKYNWNDKSISTAQDPINIEDIESENASAYVKGVKSAVDNAYNYFNNQFNWRGLSGNGDSFKVYVNSNEYVEDDLPADNALYTNNQLMFFREDLTQGDVDYNIVVHEYAHGVMSNIVGFQGTIACTENAAIAEGLADIFGELAEAQITGASPDWIHSSRNLLTPDEDYLITYYGPTEISDVDACYKQSTLVSHFAATIDTPSFSLATQNEFWFKTMCLMTSSTDFYDLQTILSVVLTDMYQAGKIDTSQFNNILINIQLLCAPQDYVY